MGRGSKRFIRLLFLVLCVAPLTAWFLVKPARLIVPELQGVECFDSGVCVDSEADYALAKKLRTDAIDLLSKDVGAFDSTPRIIFCSTWRCAHQFGLGGRSAVTFGTYGSAISPRAWKPHYVRHELIHQLQAQELGAIKCLLLPSWLLEGMAYSLSQDPRVPLEHPWESYRSQFVAWLAAIEGANMWAEAAAEW